MRINIGGKGGIYINNAIEIQNLRKVYKMGDQKVVALDNVNLSISGGEICCILGTSGSGKSTMLNMIAGLEKPSRGKVQIGKKNVETMNEKQLALFRQKFMGFIFQSYNLIPSLTAIENVSLPLVFRGVDKKKRNKAAADILAAVGLKKYVKHKPSQLSGGQQQRVGIARAFVSNPPIILADEPTGNLDSRTTEEVMQLILKLAQDNKQTLVMVTHDINVARFANRIIYFKDGNIEKIETSSNEVRGAK